MNAIAVKHLSQLEQTSDYLICKSDGAIYKDIRKAWNRIIKKAKLKSCTPNILRHTFATTLVRCGIDLLTVKELGRWSNIELVERYAHVSEDYRTRVVGILNERFGGDAVNKKGQCKSSVRQ
jgi:site-specific recombinase XerD